MSSQNESKTNGNDSTPKDIFKEYQNDIGIYLNKYCNYFESSYQAEADTVEKLNRFINMIHDYETNLRERLNSYEVKLTEIQQKFFSSAQGLKE